MALDFMKLHLIKVLENTKNFTFPSEPGKSNSISSVDVERVVECVCDTFTLRQIAADSRNLSNLRRQLFVNEIAAIEWHQTEI